MITIRERHIKITIFEQRANDHLLIKLVRVTYGQKNGKERKDEKC